MKKQGQLAGEIKKLQYQLSYSEHINKQLSAQLATVCAKVGITPSKFKQTSDIPLLNSTAHLQQLYYLQPLLMSYEEIIHLLKVQLDQAKEQAKVIQQNVQNIVKENQFLRKELQSKIQLLSKADNLGLNVNFLQMQSKDLKDKISILNSKNQYLTRKNKQLSAQCQNLSSQILQLHNKSELESLHQTIKQENKKKETERIQLQTQLSVLKSKLQNEESISIQFQHKISNMENQILKWKNQVKVVKQLLENNGVVHERLKENLENQNAMLKEQLKSAVMKQQDMFNKNMAIQSELQDKNNKIHNVNVQNSQLQANNNNMLQMLESYEVKVSGMNKKIKKLETQIKEISEEKAEFGKRAQISEWKLSQKNQEMERKESEWRKEKTRLTKMWEDRLQTMKKSFQVPNTIKV